MFEMKLPKVGKRRPHLQRKMAEVILLCWILPYIILSTVLIRFAMTRNERQIENTILTSMDGAARIIQENILTLIGDSRQASYDGVIKKSYEAYLRDGDEEAMYKEVSSYLNKTYRYSKTISNTILLYAQPMAYEYYTYSNLAGATYASIDEFKKTAEEAIRETAQTLDTRTVLVCLKGHLYVVRNIVTSDYQPFAALVMEVNMDRMFDTLRYIVWSQGGMVRLDGDAIYEYRSEIRETDDIHREVTESEGEQAASGDRPRGGTDFWPTSLEQRLSENPLRDSQSISAYDRSGHTALLLLRANDQIWQIAVTMDPGEMTSEMGLFRALFAVSLITLIPLLIATFWFFYSNLNKPISVLLKASEKIQAGEYGYQVEPFTKNEEVGELVEGFNHMSQGLKESFNRIYAEEVASRDARLKALQSQINPHFLNNTLEIINWKARMGGNEDVSEMISALSIMMNAALNRNNEMLTSLEEELSYVDAYLYIIQARFGSKFRFDKEIDESLLAVKVPRLIVQPIVENAVDHGGDGHGTIIGRLRVSREDDMVLITVENNGEMTQQDRQRIDQLLSGESPEQADRQSIGIRNVNLRLKLMYGEESGLTIFSDGTGKTISQLKIVTEIAPV